MEKSLYYKHFFLSTNPKHKLFYSLAISYEGNYLSLKQLSGLANIQVEIRPKVYNLPFFPISSHAAFSASALSCLHIASLGRELFWVLSATVVGCCYYA